MDKILRGVRFLRRYLFKNPKYTVTYLLVFWRKGFTFSVPFLSETDVTKELKARRSLIRFGDGEINLMLGLRNHYQKFSPQLKKTIFTIVKNYHKDSSHILSIPRFVNCTNKELSEMGKLQVWLPLKVMFWLYFNKSSGYVDAHSFYYDGYFERVVAPAISNKYVILITKKETVDFQKNNQALPWRQSSYVVTPSEESLSAYDKIGSDIEIEIGDYRKDEVVLLFAMGPVGKILAYEFEQKGVQSIDIGKVAEVMFTGTSIEYII